MVLEMVLEITLLTTAGIIGEQRCLTEAVGRTGWRPRRLVAGVFKTFTDSKPKGPQAISLDLTFPESDHVYGIPERAKANSCLQL